MCRQIACRQESRYTADAALLSSETPWDDIGASLEQSSVKFCNNLFLKDIFSSPSSISQCQTEIISHMTSKHYIIIIVDIVRAGILEPVRTTCRW